MDFGKSSWRTFEQGIQKEWLVTNGIGGFASSTIIGANTRRYHGLLVAALKPPVRRHLIIAGIEEHIEANGISYNLYSAETPDNVMKGYLHLHRVTIDPLPLFVYSLKDIFIEKRVCMVYGKNTTVVVYRIINGNGHTKLKLRPLLNFRDHHENSRRSYMDFSQKPRRSGVVVSPASNEVDISIYCNEGVYVREDNCYFMNMDYAVERERGLPSIDDHYIPGYFEVEVKPGEDKYITVIATTEEEIPDTDGSALIEREQKRIKELIDIAGYKDEFARKLTVAADTFIVHRESTGTKTVIAGYPWFTDWGRDTMIAFTGLTLATRRFQDAKEILYTFSKYVKNGLVPNMFPDEGQEPIYNTVDASMWYFEAVNKYIDYTGDFDFIKLNIYEALKEIIKAYRDGTDFNIKMEGDYLISAGDSRSQLTWMDVKVGNWVVTPRHGKAVEINALWYNALKVMSRLAKKYKDEVSLYDDMASKVKESFEKLFWNEEKQCLYDVVIDEVKDDKIRPNQIFAISLSYPVLEGEWARKVVECVWSELYTACGLRSLAVEDGEYIGIYKGDNIKRDGAYHQGTVWAWPIGYFITAYMRVYGHTERSRSIAMRFIEPFKDHLMDGCMGNISEIFDGNEPLVPRGCFAQAWSVAEVLRAYVEDIGIY
ncbi:MAG: amylo-alpha-1,6-glucosidase [Clostridia bacterium]|nr:amylo-alpha-1,6-glucosidase [Clostridia bacterium]